MQARDLARSFTFVALIHKHTVSWPLSVLPGNRHTVITINSCRIHM